MAQTTRPATLTPLRLPASPRPPDIRPARQAGALAVQRARLNLAPTRTQQSIELDGYRAVGRNGVPLPPAPAVGWDRFYPAFDMLWEVGPPDWPNPNVALIGRPGSGKTTLARTILQLRDRVVVFGTKAEDPSLYEPFRRLGYRLTDQFNPRDTRHPKIIYRPRLTEASAAGLAAQREQFRNALLGIFRYGGWTVYLDEVRYLTETLKLETELNLLWLQGRALGIVIVAGTQRPVSVPINMFEASAHLFTWRINGLDDRRTMAAYTGQYRDAVIEYAALLPPFECLYVNPSDDVLLRTRAPRNTPGQQADSTPAQRALAA